MWFILDFVCVKTNTNMSNNASSSSSRVKGDKKYRDQVTAEIERIRAHHSKTQAKSNVLTVQELERELCYFYGT